MKSSNRRITRSGENIQIGNHTMPGPTSDSQKQQQFRKQLEIDRKQFNKEKKVFEENLALFEVKLSTLKNETEELLLRKEALQKVEADLLSDKEALQKEKSVLAVEKTLLEKEKLALEAFKQEVQKEKSNKKSNSGLQQATWPRGRGRGGGYRGAGYANFQPYRNYNKFNHAGEPQDIYGYAQPNFQPIPVGGSNLENQFQGYLGNIDQLIDKRIGIALQRPQQQLATPLLPAYYDTLFQNKLMLEAMQSQLSAVTPNVQNRFIFDPMQNSAAGFSNNIFGRQT